jgi:hypothetical protein
VSTLLLDISSWDLIADAKGNIAVAADPYAKAQDVASACKLFAAELWFDVSKGVPYFEQILGHAPPRGLMQALIEQAAMTVPGVVSARCTIEQVANRRVTGTVRFTDDAGRQNQLELA